MQLNSKQMAGKELNFTSSVYNHASFRFVIAGDGVVQLVTDSGVLEDDKGNALTHIEVDQGPGEPELDVFLFDGPVPEEYEEFVIDVNGEDAVPARYVHGVGSVKVLTDEIPDDLAEELMADSGLGGFFIAVDVPVEDEPVEDDTTE